MRSFGTGELELEIAAFLVDVLALRGDVSLLLCRCIVQSGVAGTELRAGVAKSQRIAVDADQILRRIDRQPICNHGAVVATVRDVAVMTQHLGHQPVGSPRNETQPAHLVIRRFGQDVSRQRGHDDFVSFRRQRACQWQHRRKAVRPTVQQQNRRRDEASVGLQDREMQAPMLDRRHELRYLVQPPFAKAPVVARAPVADQLGEPSRIDAVMPSRAPGRLR